eukprot:11741221-Alexandrium_andersonii.AAC.1
MSVSWQLKFRVCCVVRSNAVGSSSFRIFDEHQVLPGVRFTAAQVSFLLNGNQDCLLAARTYLMSQDRTPTRTTAIAARSIAVVDTGK